MSRGLQKPNAGIAMGTFWTHRSVRLLLFFQLLFQNMGKLQAEDLYQAPLWVGIGHSCVMGADIVLAL